MSLRIQDFPSFIRLKLSGSDETNLWNQIEARGGVRKFCSETGFRESRVYNWRHHADFYPVKFVLEVLEQPEVLAYKGRGRSIPVKNPEIPLPEVPELQTRIKSSVSVNREGVPVYRSQERELIARFDQLLQGIGEVPVRKYSRESGYELRYPSYIHSILNRLEFETDIGARVDEEGVIGDGVIRIPGREIPVEEFSGELHSPGRKFELAVERGDSREIQRIIQEEASKVSQAFG